jgi:2-isopropylmalate synthase
VRLAAGGDVVQLQGEGRGPVEAFVDGLARATGVQMAVLDFHEHAIGAGSQAKAAAYLELRIADTRTLFGVGIDGNIVTASMKAVVSGLLRSGATLQAAPHSTTTAH